MVRVKVYYWLVELAAPRPGDAMRAGELPPRARPVGVGTRESCLKASVACDSDAFVLVPSQGGPVW